MSLAAHLTSLASSPTRRPPLRLMGSRFPANFRSHIAFASRTSCSSFISAPFPFWLVVYLCCVPIIADPREEIVKTPPIQEFIAVPFEFIATCPYNGITWRTLGTVRLYYHANTAKQSSSPILPKPVAAEHSLTVMGC